MIHSGALSSGAASSPERRWRGGAGERGSGGATGQGVGNVAEDGGRRWNRVPLTGGLVVLAGAALGLTAE